MSFVSDLLYRRLITAPFVTRAQSGAYQFAGLTTVDSGSATATVSTFSVRSGDMIFLSPLAPGTSVASGQSRSFEVKSVNTNNAFVIGTTDGQANARDTVIGWLIFRTNVP